MPQPQSDSDPLLEFTIEPDAAPPALPPPSQPVEPVAAPAVAAHAPVNALTPDEADRLRGRIDRLEKTATQSAKELRALRAEVATLVGAAADIRRGRTEIVSAIAGVVFGVAISVWFFLNSTTEPIVPRAPSASVASLPSPPAPAIVAPPSQPSLVQAAAITPVPETPARTAPIRDQREERAPRYVGTLSIDSDPPADVLVDRQPAGRTPLRITNLKAGSHLIWIERDGYHRFTRVVQVPADRVSRVVATLESDASR